MKFSIKDFFSKCDQIQSFLRMWSHLLKESLMENFIFSAVTYFQIASIYIYMTTQNRSLFLGFGFTVKPCFE